MGRRIGGMASWPRLLATRRALAVGGACAICAVVLIGCGEDGYEPESLSELPPSHSPSSKGSASESPANRPTPTPTSPADEQQTPGSNEAPTPMTTAATAETAEPPTPPSAPAPPTDEPTSSGPESPAPPDQQQTPGRQLLLDCATVHLDVPPSWNGTGNDGTWTFTPTGPGHGELTVQGRSTQVAEPPSRADLERLAGAPQAATEVRSDGSILGVETVDGAPTWRIAIGASDQTQLVTLTYAAVENSVPIDTVFDADVERLHSGAVKLRVQQVGECRGVG